MDCLRTRRVEGKAALQTPVITLENRAIGGTATLVLTAHLGDPGYFAAMRNAVHEAPGTVFFESIRPRDLSEAHWNEKYHRLLKRIREDLYVTLSDLEGLSFQGEQLKPEPEWRSADVDCCEFAAELRRRKVNTLRYELALGALDGLLAKARAGNKQALKSLQTMVKAGLMFISVGYVFEFISWLPSSRGFQSVAADWRNEVAAKIVLESGEKDFVLIYGAAHGPGLIELLAKGGYREARREWHTVFTL